MTSEIIFLGGVIITIFAIPGIFFLVVFHFRDCWEPKRVIDPRPQVSSWQDPGFKRTPEDEFRRALQSASRTRDRPRHSSTRP